VLTAGFFLNLGDAGAGARVTKSADFAETFDAVAGLDSLVAVEDVSIFNYTTDL